MLENSDSSKSFHPAKIREMALIDELRQQPVVEVIGVVNPKGSGGGGWGNSDEWTFSFTFEDWRIVGAGLSGAPMRVFKSVSKSQLSSLMGMAGPLQIVRIRAHVNFIQRQALLLEFISPPHSDVELWALVRALKEPVTFYEAGFGTFQLDRRFNWYEAHVAWESTRIRLSFSADLRREEALITARALWNAADEWDLRLRNFAAAKLLNLKNDSWLQADETEFTPDIFRSKMALQSVHIESEGRFEFWFDDGDLFWGHSILIEGDLTMGPQDAQIQG